MRTYLTALFLLFLSVFAAAADSQPELRAIWVDGFHAGIRTPAEADQLVADAKRGHFNALMIQVRRRADSLYTQSLEPWVEDVPAIPGFDPLANIIEVAHREGIEVHAWMNAMPVWRDAPPPLDPKHVFNQHGPTATGDQLWLTANHAGNFKFPVGYFLDPGHPAAADYLVRVYANVVRNYKVDGIHFDYIRYPETEGTTPVQGADVGYNPVSLARFHRAYNRTDTPDPSDPQFIVWRRQQVTNLVRRVYLEAKTINPKIQVSASVIAWGRPPVSEQDFENVAPMQRIFQNWHSWMQEGILDFALPMNYAAESNERNRGWFNGWIEWEKQHRHGRRLAVGIGAYLNSPEGTNAQIARVRQPAKKDRADGLCFFSYSSLLRPAATASAAPARDLPATPAPNGAVTPAAANVPAPAPATVPDRLSYLVSDEKAPFAASATRPNLAWIDTPKTGYVGGLAHAKDGAAIDGGTVLLRGTGWFSKTRRIATDGNGYYGFTSVKPGKYRVRIEQAGKKLKPATVQVAAGEVRHADVTAE